MTKWLGPLCTAALLAACTAFGPPAIHLTRSDIEQRAFVDRGTADLRKVFDGFEGLEVRGPDVGVQTQAQRLEFEWEMRLKDSPAGLPLSVHIAISGRPELNADRSGIDLADARVEHVRLPSIPFMDAGRARPTGGESLGRLPLLAFRPDELNRSGVIYRAADLAVGAFGVRVALAPR